MTEAEQFLETYLRERDEEYARFRKSREPVYISAWHPQVTVTCTEVEHDAIRKHLWCWTREWWESRGYDVQVVEWGKSAFSIEKRQVEAASKTN